MHLLTAKFLLCTMKSTHFPLRSMPWHGWSGTVFQTKQNPPPLISDLKEETENNKNKTEIK